MPVKREEVRLEREPIADENVGRTTSGPEISEEQHWVTVRRGAAPRAGLPLKRTTGLEPATFGLGS